MIPRRDLLRIVAIVPYADSFIRPTLNRAWWWADDILVGRITNDETIDADVCHVDGIERAEDMNLLWKMAEARYSPDENTYIAILHSGEVLAEPSAVRKGIRHNYGKKLGVMAYWMWSNTTYQVADLSPRIVHPFIPYKPSARFDLDADLFERGPNYAKTVNSVQHPVSSLLAYRFSTPDQRERWGYDPDRSGVPTRPWTKGGLI